MGTVGVVLGSPVGDKDLGFEQGVELFDGEELVSDSGAVRLDPGVLPRASRFDVAGPRVGEAAPVAKRVGGELRTVVAADEPWGASLGDELVEDLDGAIGVDGIGDQVGQRFAGELVGDVKQFQLVARGGDVELVVESPDVVGVGRSKSVGGRRRLPVTGSRFLVQPL